MKLFSPWNEERKASARRIAGLAFGALTLFVFISTVSYILHWEQDLSLLTQPLSDENAPEAANAAGKLGVRMGHALVSELFGLGSFFLMVVLTAFSSRLLLNKWKISLVRTLLITLFAAVISSFVFAFIGRLFGLDYLFGGGLGGKCGKWAVNWTIGYFGLAITGAFILILVAAFLFFSSDRFNRWFAALGTKKPKEVTEPQPITDEEEADSVQSELGEEEIIGEMEETEAEPEASADAKIAEDAKIDAEADREAEEAEGGIDPETGSDEAAESAEGSFEVVEDEGLEAEEVEELAPINNRLDPPDGLPKFQFPSIELLQNYKSQKREVTREELFRNNNKIRSTLATFKIQVTDVRAIVGPTVTLYKVMLADGVKIAAIKQLQEDLGMRLCAKGVRVVQLADSVGIEVANDHPSIVPLKATLNDDAFRNSKAELPIAIGYTITQQVRVFDLAEAPHLLVAGATKQGKSVGLNVIVTSLLYSKHPSELKFVFIDPKMVEFSSYAQLIRHYLAVLPDACDEDDEMHNAIVKKPKNAEMILRSLCTEMDERYELMSKAGCNKLTLYNEKYKAHKLRPDKGHKFLPYLVAVIDEYADLTMTQGATPEIKQVSRSIMGSVIRLAQKGRAAGIHVILATQRPSVDVIPGVIKSNFPMRIAFRTSSPTDSQTIIGSTGAFKLIGNGDMLLSGGIETERIQCSYVSGDEIDAINSFIGNQRGYGKSYNAPYYLPDVAEAGESAGGASGTIDNLDERFEEAAKLVVSTQKGSTSDLQRKLGMGYAKAGRVMDQLEAAGIVGPQEGSKPRQVLVSDYDTLQAIIDTYTRK